MAGLSSRTIDLEEKTTCQRHHVLDNLPSYPWNKSVSYKATSRIAEQKLHSKYPFHPLLGWESPYNEGRDIAFRNVLSIDRIPWVMDHQVAGDILLPLTGYLTLAIEAFRAIQPAAPSTIGMHDVAVLRGLRFELEQSVDVTTKLRPDDLGSSWFFAVWSWNRTQGWTEHCHGHLEPQDKAMSMRSPAFAAALSTLRRKDLEEVDVKREYATLKEVCGTAKGIADPTNSITCRMAHIMDLLSQRCSRPSRPQGSRSRRLAPVTMST